MKRAITTGTRCFYEFGRFRLDANRHRLLRDGDVVPLSPRAIETLTVLVQNSGKLLEREALMQAVWPETIVEDANLTVAISQLRKALNQNGDTGEFIQTIPRVGYRFVADVREVVEQPTSLIAKDNRPDARVEIDDAGENAPGLTNETEANPVGSGVSAENSEGSAAGSAHYGAVYAEDSEGSRAGSGRYKTPLFAGAILAITVVSLAALFFARYRSLPASVRAPSSAVPAGTVLSAPTTIPEKSVAVLPFENLSDDKQNAYFAVGVQDEIMSNLARIADLKVISRTSANLYKSGNGRNSREIGRQLGVAHLLEGNVQRIGDRLRVNAQLIKADSDTHEWAQTYDRDVADLFAIQSEIAQAIAGQLYAKISPSEKVAIERPPTADITAFDLYTRAKDLSLKSPFTNKKDLLQAADLLNQALARDPAFFQAYCQLAFAHDYLYFFGYDRTPARLAFAEAAIQAALRLRPDAGEAHLARADNLYHGYLDYDGALAELETARASLPNDVQLLELRGYIERRLGRWEECMHNFKRALDLDPRNLFIQEQIAATYADLRRYAEAKSTYDRALAIDPNRVEAMVGHAGVELAWKADTRSLHQVIDSIRATNPAAVPDIANTWFLCALAERDVAAAKEASIASGQNAPLNKEAVHFNRLFVEGVIARMTKDDDKAQSAFIAARAEQEKIVQAQPNYGPPLVVLGLIDAALGRKEEALREGRRAIQLLPVEKDSINGPLMIGYLAMIAAWIGDNDLACEKLATAMRYPGPLSYGELKLLPFWDPLRGDPCFEQIVTSLAPKEN